MANERDLELLDDYLANRMSNNDRSAFEHKLNADPNLHQEYELQKHLIQGIKDARVAQLKSMLNQVPVPSHATGNAIASKVLIGAVVTIIIVAAGYWFTDHQSDNAINNSLRQSAQQQQPSIEKPAVPAAEPDQVKATEQKQRIKTQQQAQETDKNQTSAGTEHSKPSLATKPDPVSAPAEKDSDKSKTAIVETKPSNDRYTFHYQYLDGKITLYGPFEGREYQVIELPVEGTTRAFLEYEDKYYSLEPGDSQIKALTPIVDEDLKKRLDEY
jgi:hypothetical protein